MERILIRVDYQRAAVVALMAIDALCTVNSARLVRILWLLGRANYIIVYRRFHFKERLKISLSRVTLFVLIVQVRSDQR